MTAMPARAAAGTYVLIDAENIDWAVSHIVGRKPEQQDRVQFDKLVAYCEQKFTGGATRIFLQCAASAA